jgi:hypothetical protein
MIPSPMDKDYWRTRIIAEVEETGVFSLPSRPQ